ncbi:MAG: hypothetical protein JWO31_3082, partial [Phycisphaerales bacterium]|nr:hypothetical protein [Phycisphaerales bacterium]
MAAKTKKPPAGPVAPPKSTAQAKSTAPAKSAGAVPPALAGVLDDAVLPVGPALPRDPAAAPDSVRTPWGKVDFTYADRAARDPIEPDAPVDPVTYGRLRLAGGSGEPVDAGPTMSPRELYEMLMTPAAHPVRPGPTRDRPDAADLAAGGGGMGRLV